MMKMLLPDVNVWLALTFDSHVHHPAAKTWFDALSGELCLFCRTTQQGFLRLATNAVVFGDSALNLSEAWKKYDVFLCVVCRRAGCNRASVAHVHPTAVVFTQGLERRLLGGVCPGRKL